MMKKRLAIGPTLVVLGLPLVLAIAPRGEVSAQTPSGVDRVSQPALVVQRFGTAEVRVVYNRPTARGRELFGALVPWDSVWNPGADEATRIELSEDMIVAGHRLAAGRYSIWATPGPDEWTLEFSSSWDQQHRPYPSGTGVLTIEVEPHPAEHMESLAFYFPTATPAGGVLALHWGEVRVLVPVEKP